MRGSDLGDDEAEVREMVVREMVVKAPEAEPGVQVGTISVQEATVLSLSVQFGFRPEEIAVALDMSAEEAGAALERVTRAVA